MLEGKNKSRWTWHCSSRNYFQNLDATSWHIKWNTACKISDFGSNWFSKSWWYSGHIQNCSHLLKPEDPKLTYKNLKIWALRGTYMKNKFESWCSKGGFLFRRLDLKWVCIFRCLEVPNLPTAVYSGPWWWIFSWITWNLRKLFPSSEEVPNPFGKALVSSPWQHGHHNTVTSCYQGENTVILLLHKPLKPGLEGVCPQGNTNMCLGVWLWKGISPQTTMGWHLPLLPCRALTGRLLSQNVAWDVQPPHFCFHTSTEGILGQLPQNVFWFRTALKPNQPTQWYNYRYTG